MNSANVSSAIFGLLLAVILAAAGLAAAGELWTLKGRVVGVADGDTLTVLDADKVQHVVRLGGIDAPERRQPFGSVAKAVLSKLVFDHRIEARCWKRDRYGREICTVFLGSRDVGLDMIRDGYAWHYKEYEREQSPEEREAYARAEERARAQRNGLWRDMSPVPPWEWRRSARPN